MRSYSSDFFIKTLPDLATTKDGIEYNPNDETWSISTLSRRFPFNWPRLNPYFDKSLIMHAKFAASECLKKKSPASVYGSVHQLIRMADLNHRIESGLISQITEAHVRVFFARCSEKGKGWHPSNTSVLKILFKTWSGLRLPGLDQNVMVYLGKINIKNYPKGINIRVNDPRKGIFSELERQGINNVLKERLADGSMSVEYFVLCTLAALYGQRPEQYAGIKLKDFRITKYDGQKRLGLKIPKGKGKGSLSIGQRKDFLTTKIIPRKFEKVLRIHVLMVIGEYKRRLRKNLITQEVEYKELPLFPSWEKKFYAPNLLYHADSVIIYGKLKRALNIKGLVSETTGEQLNVNLTRFRHTLTTQYLAEGKDPWEVCVMMGWGTTRSMEPYIEISNQMVKKITKEEAIAIAPFYHASNGGLKKKEADKKRGSVYSHDLEMDHGDCGLNKFCGAYIPYACFTCQNFEPWDDKKIHMEFLDFLIKMRDNNLNIINSAGNGLLKENRVATVHDITILACADVVNSCKSKEGS